MIIETAYRNLPIRLGVWEFEAKKLRRGAMLRQAKTIAVFAFLLFSGSSFAGRNLITNFDHRTDNGIGLPIGWTKHVRDKMFTMLDVTPQNDGSLRIAVNGEPFSFYEQCNLKLVPGGKYHLAYEVKTDGIGNAPVYLFLRDSKWDWQAPQKGPQLPDNTNGAWVRQDAELTMCDHPGASEHTLSICCTHTKPVTNVVFSLRNLTLEAVDSKTERESSPIGGKDIEKLPARIVPVDPLLSNINANEARMTFYWPAMPVCGITNCRIVSRFKGNQYKKTVPARFDAKGYAMVNYGRVWPSKYEIEVEVVDDATNCLAKNEYKITVRRPEKDITVGKRLNNLVTSLVDQPLANGEVMFSRATPGWIWISFEGAVDTGAVAYLDEIGYPVVRYRDGECHIEAQRFVDAGSHTLRITGVKGNGRLRINAVKTIWGSLPKMTSGPTYSYRWSNEYTLKFCNRFDIHTALNTYAFRMKSRQHVNPVISGYANERGMRTFANINLNPDGTVIDDFDATWKTLTEGPWTDGFSLSVDENKVNQHPRRTVNYSEAVWKMIYEHPEQSVNLFYADTSYGNYYDRPQSHVSEIAATANSGNGTGLLVPELYAAVRQTPAELDRYLDAYARFVTSALEMVPSSRGKVVLYGASYVQLGDWSNYVEPSTDIKAHYARMYRAFATDPRFAECAGLGCGGMGGGGEELLRWMAKCVRYYALEGGTGDLADEVGFAWTPGFVKNADMNEGLLGWTAKGDIVAEKLSRYGVKNQNRQAVPFGFGDGVATFTTKADAPNELSQRLSGLKPGQLYGVLCCVCGRDQVARGGGGVTGPEAPIGFSVKLERATEIPSLRVEKISGRRKVSLRTLRYVFRATSETARLVFIDRNDDGTAAPDGFKQSLNYISFMPYYLEPSGDPADVARALGWEGGNRIRDRR